MKRLLINATFFLSLVIFLGSCTIINKATFPAPDDVFITTGDGDIQKPYTPVGQLFYYSSSFYLLGLIPIKTVDPDLELKTNVYNEVKNMGGDALINMNIDWEPGRRLLIFYIKPPYLNVQGTVVKR